MAKPVCVMKFGGTSVGDADCIRRAASIVKSAAANSPVVVVVSAMSGVTNRLIDAASRAKSGQSDMIAGLNMMKNTGGKNQIKCPTRQWDIASPVVNKISRNTTLSGYR